MGVGHAAASLFPNQATYVAGRADNVKGKQLMYAAIPYAEAQSIVSDRFAPILRRHTDIAVIVSPPRCGSTALARVFWEHPTIRYYCHEPFEGTYYLEEDLDSAVANLEGAIDLSEIKRDRPAAGADGLVIKEMPYQASENFSLLASLATRPLVFLIRDPKLSIASRMAKKREVGDDPLFPEVETGWELLCAQIAWCQEHGVPYAIVDGSDIRNHPRPLLRKLLARLELDFSEELLRWRSVPRLEIDNLKGRHRHLYSSVLGSTGLVPATEPVPPIDHFPKEGGFRAHVVKCYKLFQLIRRNPNLIKV